MSESFWQERFWAGIPKRDASKDAFDSKCKSLFMLMSSSLNPSVDVVAGWTIFPPFAACSLALIEIDKARMAVICLSGGQHCRIRGGIFCSYAE